jgi:hypothetical protein
MLKAALFPLKVFFFGFALLKNLRLSGTLLTSLCLAEFVTPKRQGGLAEACTEETLMLILVWVFERNVLRIIVSGQQ